MGASTALAGIKDCMTILHGSQGCATYIRRHLATHYNEPVDIASSSLTEQGTVYGGEENLLKGLKNTIELYHPDVIGVATTCLAETIGEDPSAIVQKYLEQNPDEGVKIVTVASPGYGGTQNEGYFAALRAVVEQFAQCESGRTDLVNVITPLLSPADIRWLKTEFECNEISYVLLPDISDNLDGVTAIKYKRLKSGGTSIKDIEQMGSAGLTIEFSDTIKVDLSPGQYLKDKFGVPLIRLPLPIGIQNIRKFNETLGISPDSAVEGRYLDAMVDNHKYCAKARTAIYGEPDFVKAVISLCCEIGVVPSVIATGSRCPELFQMRDEAKNCADNVFAAVPIILDDTDFDAIERAVIDNDVNLLIGSSDGRRIASKLGIELIRCAFPIHDRVGGARIRTLGYEGSLWLIDSIANAMLRRTEESFREELYDAYYQYV
jgi:nitrogenase molybdenum-iron protein alpha/beta subunit